MTPGDLPPANTRRWVLRRKADVVMAVTGGMLSMEEACWRYSLTRDEFLEWQFAFERLGAYGLRNRTLEHIRRLKRHGGDM